MPSFSRQSVTYILFITRLRGQNRTLSWRHLNHGDDSGHIEGH
jgi:hypothetical protein